jgi:uncharacterized protein YndB with AHSA1/START domain
MELPIEHDIVLPVSPEEAWDALTDATAWLADEAQIDLTEGGEGRFLMPGGGERRALIEEVSEGERLALWWWPVDADGIPDSPGSRVVFVLEPVVDGGTRVRVTDTPVAALALALAHA